ncbi:sensor histidine kinase [Alkalibacter mobilis]|uniref:sensor histidine kinase n=1 Tax=Alkalibacter mobilis TaxID=2787712 RepID=UPI0018A0438C|nr:HAMP domain-containing sensor histidine kinase [Alkalibacter mobilis]MBF7097895.1 HAMP domain-containing histidine kinase [Alkalibacter mobilis]
MKKTIFTKIFIYMSILILATLIILIVAVNFFLDDFYYSTQEKLIESTTDNIVNAYNSGDEELESMILYYADNLGIGIRLISSDGTVLYSQNFNENYSFRGNQNGHGMFFRMQSNDDLGEQDWLVFTKELNDGGTLIARSSYESFERTVGALRNFILYLIPFILVLSLIMIYKLSKGISKPLVDLNGIAIRMKNLEFDAKYTGREENEIGQLGQTLNEMTVKLENTISKLTLELEKEKNLDAMRREFVARVSHEIQTPVSVIKGYIEAVEDGVYENEDDTAKAMNVIAKESDKISQMTQDLLDLSQLESGNYKINKKILDFGQLIKEIFDKFKFNKKNMDVIMELEEYENEIFVIGDELRLEQVLNNLLNNAFNHVPKGGKILLKVNKVNGGVVTTVYNQGSRIEEKDLPYIWESFYKNDHNSKGVGLGLSISKNIIKLHDGAWAVRNVSDGVEFSFELKVVESVEI